MSHLRRNLAAECTNISHKESCDPLISRTLASLIQHGTILTMTEVTCQTVDSLLLLATQDVHMHMLRLVVRLVKLGGEGGGFTALNARFTMVH